MKIIRVISRPTDTGRNVVSMQVLQGDDRITDEQRNTVYNVMRLMAGSQILIYDEGTWDDFVYA